MATNLLALIAGSQTVTTTTEKVVYTTPAISMGPGQQGIWVSGDVQITPGTATTSVTVKLRAGTSISSPQVDATAAVPVTAGTATQVPYNLFDLTTEAEQAGGQQYVITVTQAAATANGTVNGGHVGVEI